MGQNFRLHQGGEVFNEATSCQVTIQSNTEDTAHKDIADGYTHETATSRQWSVQVETLEATAQGLRALVAQFNSDTPGNIGWDYFDGAGNATPGNAGFAREGEAILNDLSIQANNRTIIRTTAQFQGTGALS